jgi:hypothetical protein
MKSYPPSTITISPDGTTAGLQRFSPVGIVSGGPIRDESDLGGEHFHRKLADPNCWEHSLDLKLGNNL